MDKKLRLESFDPKFQKLLLDFAQGYRKVTGDDQILNVFVERLRALEKHPFTFEPYHRKVRKPFDYYQFGLDFIRPLVEIEHSSIVGIDVLKKIDAQLHKKENVVLLANHQTETDPQAIAILLEKDFPHIGEKIIYVAGERVVTDPLAIPFSMGCDLLCIYSKRYIDHPPELKMQKQLHNKNTMELMSRLLQEGGKIIYVAPSGGRDRRGASGEVEVAPFDPASIEMFYLMARKAKTATHFYPFTLATYDLLPPPETIQKELGEVRRATKCPIHIAFSPEFDMEHFPGSEEKEKTARRQNRADAIWKIVNKTYGKIK
ncbi:MAG: 1-acyl-sn-glycerol-3-phosphate acyltransferase [Verrucomicrobia bacterium]|nr:1-acyl-sn-glycerol-3-phosphate acyltransferase [Verrucomicrobiota bacterium]MBU6445998.1 1-acyl-sn-glycerol-3-phosphate acyltransferase [Verrucomicrobiota bacterium]MDE3046962.1 1-acyl-sn-glycerol-3-phosphate acyltransferase [Verrucomicrobiota bacterium]